MSSINHDPLQDAPVEDFQDLYEHAPVGYLSMQTDGLILQANGTLAGWSGRAKADLIGKRFSGLLTVGTRIFYETNVAPLLRMQGGFNEMSLELRTAEGGVLPVFAHAQLLQADSERRPVVRLALTKALDRRRYEQELVEARAAARAAEARTQTLLDGEREIAGLREEFIAVLGHDLRNPLASISGGVNLLKRDMPPERRALIMEMLEGSVIRMGGLLDNVLDFARGRLGAGIPLDLQTGIVLMPILEQVVSELRLGDHDRIIETDFTLATPIKCDPSRIGQLLSNLLGNALTHGLAGKPVRVHADQKEGMLTIWVGNTGEPIPAGTLERLFHPFFRGEGRSSRQGLGLGLHIASEIAKAHGGTLGVASDLEETRFTFRMPILT